MTIKLLDCTLRDGGYYNSWDFSHELVEEYLKAMDAISADYIELGFRTLQKDGYKGACGYTTDSYICSLNIPEGLKNFAVMVNAGELVKYQEGVTSALEKLFAPASESPVSLVRLACHFNEVEEVLPAISWLKENGYKVAVNLMQIADQDDETISSTSLMLSKTPLDILYFADSLGSLNSEEVAKIINTIRGHWSGELGFHAHNNMNQGLTNTISAMKNGATWIDGTVLGMGRGAGNAQTEFLAIELEEHRNKDISITKLLEVIKLYFKPLQEKYEWGVNAFYYLAGKRGIHPTYIQEMLQDNRYDAEDALITIEQLVNFGPKKFNPSALESARKFYGSNVGGDWNPSEKIKGRDVLILGTGPSVKAHKKAIESYIKENKPFVISLNTQAVVSPELVDLRAACHPMRLLADSKEYCELGHPLATPVSQLPNSICESLGGVSLLDFGLDVQAGKFDFKEKHCLIPKLLVVAYALAIATSGNANKIFLAGFDGYEAGDPRNDEMNEVLNIYRSSVGALELTSVTPTKYKLSTTSIYAL